MRQCELCLKGSIMGGKRVLLRGHYNPTGQARKYPNVQKIRLTDGRRLMVCTQCIKSISNGKIKIAAKPAKKPETKLPVAT